MHGCASLSNSQERNLILTRVAFWQKSDKNRAEGLWGVKIRVRPGERGHMQAGSNFRSPHAFERFERLTRRLVSVPKAEVDELKKRERQNKRRRAARKA